MYIPPLLKLPIDTIIDKRKISHTIQDPNKPIGTGAEGSVFALTSTLPNGDPLYLKVYHPKIFSDRYRDKVLAMTSPDRLQAARPMLDFSSHPLSAAYAPSGKMIGFIMRGFEQGQPISAIFNKKELVRRHPRPSNIIALTVATHLAALVYRVHQAGYIIGDMNPNNFLVNTKLEVFALDVDSYQMKHDGKLFRCAGKVENWIHPDLHGQDFTKVELQSEHDYYALSKIIFHLLMFGHDPFFAVYNDRNREVPMSDLVKLRHYPYDQRRAKEVGISIPPSALRPEDFSHRLATRFRNAFMGSFNQIPRAQDWFDTLTDLRPELVQCEDNITHHHHKDTQCPMCAKQQESGGKTIFYQRSPYHG